MRLDTGSRRNLDRAALHEKCPRCGKRPGNNCVSVVRSGVVKKFPQRATEGGGVSETPTSAASLADCDGWALSIDDTVVFHENPEHPRVLGVVTRLWKNNRYVTLRSDGRTFVREGSRVSRRLRKPGSDPSGLPS